MKSLKDWYYSSWLGGKHLEFLLWLDSRKQERNYYLTPQAAQQIIRQYSLLDRGVVEMKGSINKLVMSKSKEEYDALFKEVDNLIDFAAGDSESPQARLADLLRSVHVRKNKEGNEQDVITATDRAKMIEKKIEGVREYQEHVKQRNMLREVRQLRTAGKNEEADKLFKEWQDTYGRSRTNNRRT